MQPFTWANKCIHQQDLPLSENFPFILNGDSNCGMLFIVSGWEVGAVSKPIQETGLNTVHDASPSWSQYICELQKCRVSPALNGLTSVQRRYSRCTTAATTLTSAQRCTLATLAHQGVTVYCKCVTVHYWLLTQAVLCTLVQAVVVVSV